ncbi:serine/threonine protein kinase [Lasiosphaeria ovina]|uniref:non-specific serine/threonine protein kinase n=1 Tax=Lasiosphaeria ovina TaxID=92902 RepID=A0AAE0TV13_9PEZI|nr:serine/threonine protein kinase [Lasiosphaeria ovina]
MDLADFQIMRHSATKLRAIDDANEMQAAVARECGEAGVAAPPYRLTELIGKGSFGRVYKARGQHGSRVVAVKIMSIEEGDWAAPGECDTFAEVLKEVNTLRLLHDSGARNINPIVDALLIGQSIWVVTEYCAGGSVATLMRPTGRLREAWIVPILREVAEAVYWVHSQGVMHRDLKCANVLVAEDGGVQLCDFGVAGVVKSRFDKRSTVTGTLQWMAPELFDSKVSYGSEVDIWAFGSMAYEAATGLPPNAASTVDVKLEKFGNYLRTCCPRLEGDQYSAELKGLIEFCMVPSPVSRPHIEQVQKHPYIFGSAQQHPTHGLRQLVQEYRDWEREGGDRRSLFSAGGAQRPRSTRSCSMDAAWDYGSMDEADQLSFPDTGTAASSDSEHQSLPKQRRRHRRPQNTNVQARAVTVPLERTFDPNILSNYKDNARQFYGSGGSPTATAPLLSLQIVDGSSDEGNIRESPVRANSAPLPLPLPMPLPMPQSIQSDLTDAETIKPPCQTSVSATDMTTDVVRFDTTRTQDWTFPAPSPRVQETVISAAPPSPHDNALAINMDPAHPWLEAPDHEQRELLPGCRAVSSRMSVLSLIDLDAGLPLSATTVPTASEANHLPLISPMSLNAAVIDMEPLAAAAAATTGATAVMDFALRPGSTASSRIPRIEVGPTTTGSHNRHSTDSNTDSASPSNNNSNRIQMPALPPPPAADVLLASAARDVVRHEITRLLCALREHLSCAGDAVAGLPVRRATAKSTDG